MKKSQEFLDKYPKTVYESKLRSDRASFLSRTLTSKNSIENIIKEYKAVLNSEYKKMDDYVFALISLKRLYLVEIGDEKTANIYKKAEIEYIKRIKRGDVFLPKQGVNDFLITNGISLEETLKN